MYHVTGVDLMATGTPDKPHWISVGKYDALRPAIRQARYLSRTFGEAYMVFSEHCEEERVVTAVFPDGFYEIVEDYE